ncbi:MAG: hypothetical protein ACM3ZE_01550, partial [Myxococcales bacterium]
KGGRRVCQWIALRAGVDTPGRACDVRPCGETQLGGVLRTHDRARVESLRAATTKADTREFHGCYLNIQPCRDPS